MSTVMGHEIVGAGRRLTGADRPSTHMHQHENVNNDLNGRSSVIPSNYRVGPACHHPPMTAAADVLSHDIYSFSAAGRLTFCG